MIDYMENSNFLINIAVLVIYQRKLVGQPYVQYF